jgi:hypothetical protein
VVIITLKNDGTGDPPEVVGNYDYEVFINLTRIASGRVEGHLREDGWEGLVKKFGRELKGGESS